MTAASIEIENTEFDVAVVGGGFGLLVALMFAEQGERVIVLSDRPTKDTTLHAVAAGLGEPIASDDERVGPMFEATRQWVFGHEHREAWGMALRTVRLYGKTADEVSPAWADAVGGLNVIESDHPDWPEARNFDSFVIQPDIAHDHIRSQLNRYGAVIHEDVRFESEAEVLAHAAVAGTPKVVIATGIEMNKMLPNGRRPISAGFGYVIRTKMTPETDTDVSMTTDLTYMIPQVDHVVWGGSLVESDADDVSTMEDHDDVLDKLKSFNPYWPIGEKTAEFIAARPLSPRLILEAEHRDDQMLVRVGGLGGSGWTLSFGMLTHIAKTMRAEPPQLRE